ncbi:MAG: HEAT repeat domain-containing protein, partial [Myxococcales bacterium]|nr:HEAT repeat domain-containing protein [Myxococcales bacterium]
LAAKAAVQLGLREVESAIPDLIAAWENENLERMQPFFAIALGLLGDDRGQELLQAYLRTPEIRNHAAVALAGIGQGEAALFELEFALDDPDPLVRFHAIRALALIGPSRIEEHLRRMSEDPDENVAAYATRELLRLQRRGRSPR